MNGEFCYNSFGPDQTRAVIEAYIDTGSCERASLKPGVYGSSATVHRLVHAAVNAGILCESDRPSLEGPRINRDRILALIDTYPHLTRKAIAQRVGCGVSTVYRALRERKL